MGATQSNHQDSNSFDLDNSDELNKFISKYEESNNLLDNSGSKRGSSMSNKKSTESGSRKTLGVKKLNEKSTD